MTRPLDEAISDARRLSPDLADRLEEATRDLGYGLSFERHRNEPLELWCKLPEVGDSVRILPPRGQKEGADGSSPRLGTVESVDDGMTHVTLDDGTKAKVPIDDVVVMSGDVDASDVGLMEVDRVSRGNPDGPTHMVMEAENLHALTFLCEKYEGKVDCIYIDPPYNTGAKGWKYDNDYTRTGDEYRHSGWLSFMEERLRLAKRLLRPEGSVLIVAIDEKEYLRLGLLLEQTFPEADVQMVTSVISAKGAVRKGRFSRVEEYLFVLTFGDMPLRKSSYDMLGTTPDDAKDERVPVEWLGFRRREPRSTRENVPNQFYPVFVDEATGRIVGIGDTLKESESKDDVPVPDGCVAIWPTRPDGSEMSWSLVPDSARERLAGGFLRMNNWDERRKRGTLQYLPGGVTDGIRGGRIEVTGRRDDGSVIARYRPGEFVISPKRVWDVPSHNAETYGTRMVSSMIGKRKFTYPKSLYAVEDCLRFFVADKPDALILDFFAGSGTTLHATMLMNSEDGGHRRCVCVTNDEMSRKESERMTEDGLRPWDERWKTVGIARHVAWPRVKCAILGTDVDGRPLRGNYLRSDRPMSDGFEENAVLCELTYEPSRRTDDDGNRENILLA